MTAGEIASQQLGDVLVISLDHPPSNAITAGMRAALVAILSDPGPARAIVIRAQGEVFSAAVTQERDGAQPDLAALCLAVERCRVPVVAALHGSVVGPGAELALAAQARVARQGTRLAFPDIAVGLPPQAGASQRLPLLVGPGEAIQMLLTGRAVPANEALAVGLIDRLVGEGETAAAVALAEAAMDQPRPQRGPGNPVAYQAAIANARRAHKAAMPAVGRIIDCVEAALVLPFENGLALEAVAREDLEASDEAQALRAAAEADRRTLLLPAAIARAVPRLVNHIGLNGTGPGLASLALLALTRGFSVSWVAQDAAALTRSLSWIEDRLQADQRAGRLEAADHSAAQARLHPGAGAADLAQAGLVVHALKPDADDLRHSPAGTPHVVMGGADGEIGLALARSGRMSEVSLPREAAPEAVATLMALLRRMGVAPVLVGHRPVLGRRLAAAGDAALARMIGQGVPRRLIAAALESFGARLPDAPLPDLGPAFRQMPEAEVVQRWLGALANEGLRLLDAGIALRPSDVDHCLVAGQAFPRWRGGPMFLADRGGLMVLRRDLRLWAEDDPIWSPAPLLDRLISDGRRLSGLNG